MKTVSTALTRPRSVVGRRERDRRRADVDADHVGEAADGERDERERERASRGRRPPCSSRTARRRPRSVGPAWPVEGQRVRSAPATSAPTAGALRRMPSPTGPVCRIVCAKTRQQRDGAAEEHREQVEQDRAEHDARAPEEEDAAEQVRKAGRLVAARRPAARTVESDRAGERDAEEGERGRVDGLRPEREQEAAERRAGDGGDLVRDRAERHAAAEQLDRDELGASARAAGEPSRARLRSGRRARGTARAGATRSS